MALASSGTDTRKPDPMIEASGVTVADQPLLVLTRRLISTAKACDNDQSEGNIDQDAIPVLRHQHRRAAGLARRQRFVGLRCFGERPGLADGHLDRTVPDLAPEALGALRFLPRDWGSSGRWSAGSRRATLCRRECRGSAPRQRRMNCRTRPSDRVATGNRARLRRYPCRIES